MSTELIRIEDAMKITVFNGSPKGEKSNTNFICKEFLYGAEKAGADVENIFLVKHKIANCLGCFCCWEKTPGKCVIKDDMSDLIVKFINSDVVVFATPLYVDNVSGLMKTFMDRLIPIADPHFEKDENNETRHIKRFEKYPKIIVVSNCGFPEENHFQVLKLLFRRIARNMHSEVIGEIYRGGGEILSVDMLILKPLIWKYKKILRQAGKEIVENLSFSEETVKKLNKPIISEEKYIKGANKRWDESLKNIDEN
jgi:multimeric flavodoxin WrbA